MGGGGEAEGEEGKMIEYTETLGISEQLEKDASKLLARGISSTALVMMLAAANLREAVDEIRIRRMKWDSIQECRLRAKELELRSFLAQKMQEPEDESKKAGP
ncbi:MAG: hypothetical protein PHR35_22935 [Kiritimatiellae bacterium]|nr:hypothetical protein [Kiritimatiellia bacterium]